MTFYVFALLHTFSRTLATAVSSINEQNCENIKYDYNNVTL